MKTHFISDLKPFFELLMKGFFFFISNCYICWPCVWFWGLFALNSRWTPPHSSFSASYPHISGATVTSGYLPCFFFFVLFLFLSQQIYASLRGDFGFCIQRWFSSCLGLKRSARLLLTFLDPRIIKMPQARQLLVLAVSCLTLRSRHLILAERSRITSEKKTKKTKKSK